MTCGFDRHGARLYQMPSPARLTFTSEQKAAKIGAFVIARSEATKQSSFGTAAWIASLRSQ
jgi:hypothetical protein